MPFFTFGLPANELEIAILNLFIDIKVRYPNLIVGKLERETVKRAMDEGITAQQVRTWSSRQGVRVRRGLYM